MATLTHRSGCRRPAVLAASLLVLASSACGSDSAQPPPTTSADARAYASQTFSIGLTVTLPDDLKLEANPDSVTLLSWDSNLAQENAVRFVLPVNLYKPKQLKPVAPPQDYLAYLRSLTEQGATYADEKTTTVDGHAATLMTANTAEPLDGVLGCAKVSTPPADCFGLQPDLSLRIAVIDVNGKTLLAWARTEKNATDVPAFFAEFEAMLKGLKFTPDIDRKVLESFDWQSVDTQAMRYSLPASSSSPARERRHVTAPGVDTRFGEEQAAPRRQSWRLARKLRRCLGGRSC